MLRKSLAILLLIGALLPFYVSINAFNTKKSFYHKTTLEDFKYVKLTKTKSVQFKATSITELDKNFWQARNPIINEDISDQKNTTTEADLGIIRQDKNIIELFDNVTRKSSDPNMSELKTEHLIIRKNLEAYETKGFTVLKNNNQILTGYDFIFDQLNNKFIIPKQSKLVYNR